MAENPRSARLEAARTMLGLSLFELWYDYLGVGGRLMPQELQSALAGGATLDDREHDFVAQALNERFLDRDEDHPLAYANELEQRD